MYVLENCLNTLMLPLTVLYKCVLSSHYIYCTHFLLYTIFEETHKTSAAIQVFLLRETVEKLLSIFLIHCTLSHNTNYEYRVVVLYHTYISNRSLCMKFKQNKVPS